MFSSLQFLTIALLFKPGFSLLSVDNANNASILSAASGTGGYPDNINVLNAILTQETALRIQLQKQVEDLANEINSLKRSENAMNAKAKALDQEISTLKRDNQELMQHILLVNETCRDCQNQQTANIDVPAKSSLSHTEDLKKQLRYLTLSLMDIQRKYDDMNITFIESLKNTSDEFRYTLKNIMVDVLQTKQEQNKLKFNITDLDSIHRNISKLIRDDVDSGLQSLQTILTRVEHQQSQMDSSLTSLETNLTQMLIDGEKIGFTAGYKVSDSSWSGAEDMIFPAVVHEIGGGYNTQTGIFTVRKKGFYILFATILGNGSQTFCADIIVNGTTKVRLLSESGSYQSSSNMVFIYMNVGDRAWLRHAYGAGIYSTSTPTTTFSAIRI